MRKLFADVWLLLEIVLNLSGAMIIWWIAFRVAYSMLPELEGFLPMLLEFYSSVVNWLFAFICTIDCVSEHNSSNPVSARATISHRLPLDYDLHFPVSFSILDNDYSGMDNSNHTISGHNRAFVAIPSTYHYKNYNFCSKHELTVNGFLLFQ